jgi:glycosyltransferase involved in cell wall biosynthesis
MQKILVITSTIPNDLAGGDKLYTYYLFKELAQHISVTIVGYKDLHGKVNDSNWVQEIITVPYVNKSKHLSVLSRYPNPIFKNNTRLLRKTLRKIVQNHKDYNVIICDHLRTCWAAEVINTERKKLGLAHIPTIFIAHNHETLLREQLVACESNLLKSVFWLDAKKTRWHENKTLSTFDKIIAITADDAKSINAISGAKADVITPGYCGLIKDRHLLTQKTNRQAVILGNYYSHNKQLNLMQLVKAAASVFPKAGVKLQIVGAGPASLFAKISQYQFVDVVGYVESFNKYLENSRVAIIAETIGGGFKLKALDYVFGKIPMAVLKGTMAGLPLQANKDYLEYTTLEALIDGIVQEIDNIEKLNLIASNALAACRHEFSWKDRGNMLYKIVCELTRKGR